MVRYSVRAFRQKVYRSWSYYQKTFPSKTVGSALNYPSRTFFFFTRLVVCESFTTVVSFFSFFMIVFNKAGSGTKRKVQTLGSLWGSRQGSGLEVGNEADKIGIFCRETKKKSVLTWMELPRCMKICGRFVWLILRWAQLGVFCFYVHLCWDFSVLASIVFSWFFVNCILRLVLGPVILLFSKRKPHYDPYIWLGYTVLFIVDF